ncbi:hypothetical protein [Aristaeella lactis]|uniref:Uncharacterized protein n=1 Tax=Aristaeella lactis TaxID=3046383 RepID=A0AC61PIG7_9FIRM|nr:hypothetical protein [Aristaeella lactis]QUA53784.1 hypothetical protein JYE50_03910 [Aristaeella lactis]SMC39460.1 hypothetical protein SAMN06297397_0579 [Aristaeella lactis]
MKVKLLREARIRHKAGEIVEVSPAEAGFLFSTNSAVEYAEPVKAEKPETKAKKETPEAEAEAKETPEAKNKPKSTRSKK